MEISKGLQKEIVLVQNKLKNAICDHQICMGKLKDDPNNADIRGQIQQIQLDIVSLGRCQKQVVERLRKEVEGYQAQNDKGVKLSVASLLGLTNNNNNINNNNHASSNNNNHFTPNNDQDKDDVLQVKVQANGLAKRRRLNKDNFRNGVNKKIRAKETPVETLSIDDDVIELSIEENDSNEKEENIINENDVKTPVDKSELQQTEFLDKLGLITISNFDKLQSKKAERKRRSRANPQFVCSTWELPTKKKRHSYLQSGNAPQTRQTTARLNGPSPPPPPPTATSSGQKVQKSQSVTKSVAGSPPPSPSSSSSSQSSNSKSLLPAQKPSGKPNILRNLNETLAHGSCNKTLENGSKSQTITSNSNSVKSSPSKVMNIPGLPSSLTIEKIENDVVCIHCRSPGMLSTCENCSANYHTACHVILPPPQRQCPKCYEMNQDNEVTSPVIKKSDEIEEKERERYEQRERNADLRLQVYEMEKRSQLLGQSLQVQHRLKQELLSKQEKTQKSIKRLVDFIKLMQQPPASTQTSGSSSCHHQSSSSPSARGRSPAPTSPSPTTHCSQVRSTSPTTSSAGHRTKTPSPIHPSSSTSSPRSSPASGPTCSRTRDSLTTTASPLSVPQTTTITTTTINNTITINNITSTNITNTSSSISNSNHIRFLSSKSYPILVSVDSSPATQPNLRVHQPSATVCQSPRDQQSSVMQTNNQASLLSTTVSVQLIQGHPHLNNFSQVLPQEFPLHHPRPVLPSTTNDSPRATQVYSTSNSPRIGSSPSPSDPTGSPLAAQCPDSTVSQCLTRKIPALRIQVHQLDQLTENDVSITYVKTETKSKKDQWRVPVTSVTSSGPPAKPVMSCEQGPSLPITSPMIVSKEISISSLGQLSSDCTGDSLKAKSQPTLRQRDSPPSELTETST
ncbi:mucin-5AC-like isoform X2 [Cotesia glomerata]|uniref:mucin-5AC-like isoform X2 n=1 Tax=Cotesia glomerata TaxID=32391 RepID=UPI001D029100|nr:mucin-5AC-like isoform X2 [Cotesia glomerata]